MGPIKVFTYQKFMSLETYFLNCEFPGGGGGLEGLNRVVLGESMNPSLPPLIEGSLRDLPRIFKIYV